MRGPIKLIKRLITEWRARRNLGMDLSVLVLERVVRLVVGVLVSSLLARHLGAEGFGQLSLGLAIGGIGLSVASLGLDVVLVGDIARDPASAPRSLFQAMILRAGAAAIVWPILFVWVVWTVPNPEAVIILALLSFGAFSGVSALWFQATGKARLMGWIQIGVFLAASAARLLFLSFGASLAIFAWLAVVEVFLFGILVLWCWVRLEGKVDWRAMTRLNAGVLWALLRRGMPWWATSVCVIVFTRLDQVVLYKLGGADALGIFAAAGRLSDQAQLLPMALAIPMLGRIAGSQNEPDRIQRIKRYLAVSSTGGYVVGGAIWMCGPWALAVLFGNEFEPAGEVLRIQALGVPLLFVAVARGQILAASGRGGTGALIGAIAGAITGFGLNLYLVPAIGAKGAAWSGVAAQLVASLIAGFFIAEWRWLAWLQISALFTPWRLLRT